MRKREEELQIYFANFYPSYIQTISIHRADTTVLFQHMKVIVTNEESSIILLQPKLNKSIRLKKKLIVVNSI